jgi:imidazolonepropionase-like amidohydrolase
MLSLLIAFVPAVSILADDAVLAIKARKILPISGEPIQNGVILIREGKIAAVGPKVKIPDGASVIDAADRVVMPGLVDARAQPPVRGDSNEQSQEITPDFRIARAVDPQSKELKRRLQTGTTTLYVPPGGNNLIAGFGAVLKPRGDTASEMILRDEAALHLTMGSDSTQGNRSARRGRPDSFYYRRPTTRMAVAWMLRKGFLDAQQYARSHDRRDPVMEVLAAALQKEIPLRVTVRRAIDIRTAFRIADEYGLRIILDECTEGYKVADLIAEKQAPVVLGPFYFYPRTPSQYREGEEVNWNNAGILAKSGVQVALASGAESQTGSLLSVAMFAVRHGMPRDKALQGVTLTAAEVLGVADRVGSLDKGKDADILILNGDPLDPTSRIQRVILKGQTVCQAE